MNLLPEIAALDADMRTWRHHIHAHPETAFEEEATIDHPAHETVAGFLDAVQGRTPSWTWRVPEERLNAALDVGRRWTVERYGTTDIRLEERVRQRWWVFEVS